MDLVEKPGYVSISKMVIFEVISEWICDILEPHHQEVPTYQVPIDFSNSD